MPKIEIIPAILPRNFSELQDKVGLVSGLVKTVQVDVCDGQFVPNATWPYRKQDDNFDKIVSEEIGLPDWEKLNYEVDLMVNKAEEVVEQWVSAGVSRIILHAEMKGDMIGAIDKLSNIVEIGFALNMDTNIGVIEKYKEKIQFVQCMGIDKIGFQGQAFDEKVIEKIRSIRSSYPSLPISVDGGVSLENAKALIEAGASRLVVGSAIFDSDNVFESIERFKRV